MPARNTIRLESENGYYHIYNRGVEKRIIFNDEQDHKVFLRFLKDALNIPPDPLKIKSSFTLQGHTFQGIPHNPKSFYKRVELLAYCLMPNHFHLILFQKEKCDIGKFMQSIITRYSIYFNKKYDRVGPLFQGPYRAVFIDNENYLVHLSRYIHLNPAELTKDLEKAFSSYADYLGTRNTIWVKPKMILSFFNNLKIDFIGNKGINSYRDFVEKYQIESGDILGSMTLE